MACHRANRAYPGIAKPPNLILGRGTGEALAWALGTGSLADCLTTRALVAASVGFSYGIGVPTNSRWQQFRAFWDSLPGVLKSVASVIAGVAALIAAAAAVITAVGKFDGGSDSSGSSFTEPPSPTRAEWVRGMNDVCVRTIALVRQETSERGAAVGFATGVDNIENVAYAPDDETDVSRMIALWFDAFESWKRALDARDREDKPSLRAESRKARESGSQGNRLALTLGALDCSEMFPVGRLAKTSG